MKQVFKTNSLKKLAEDYIESDEPIKDSEIKDINITPIWEKEVYFGMLVSREIIKININAKVRGGKSTVNFAIMKKVQDSINSLGYSKVPWSIKNIARTSYELSKKMRDPNLNNMAIAIDEFDDMESTQMNSTIEQALLDHFSKIQAGRYIHNGYCSPADMPDTTSDIHLIVDQPNKETKKTKCLVYYRFQKADRIHTQLIGHIIVDVAPIVKNWVKQGIEKRFYSFNKSKADKEFINKWRKKDWYIDYMCRKFEKFDLLNKMGIFQVRELDYADIYMECIDKLKPMTKLDGLVTQKVVKNQLKILFRQHVVPTTLLGDALMSERVDGILEFYKQYYKLDKNLVILKKKLEQNKIPLDDYEVQRTLIKDSMKTVMTGANEQEEELKLLGKMKKSFYDEA